MPRPSLRQEQVPLLERKVESGLRKGRAIRRVFDLLLVGSAVLIFAFDDTPARPYLVATAVVMGGILLFWPWLKKRLG